MLYTFINVYHQTGEQSMVLKTESWLNMQESLASCVSASAILDVKLTLCCSVEGLMYLEMQYACHTCVAV